MGNFAEGFYQMGYEEGYKEGREEVAEEDRREILLVCIDVLMNEFHLPLQQALTMLEIPEEEWQMFEALIEDFKAPSITSSSHADN